MSEVTYHQSICGKEDFDMTNRVESLGEVVANTIKRQIFDEHRYRPGDRLPVEQELADEMQVSRTALREGMKALEFQGIIEIRRGVGTFVSTSFGLGTDVGNEPDEDAQRSILREWYEARLGTDVQSARLAAANATDDEIAEIAAIQDQIRSTAKSDADFFRLDSDFHRAIIRASHNRILMAQDISTGITSWSYYLVASQRRGLRRKMSENATVNHDLIVTCLKERDSEGAALAMRCHLIRAIRDLA